MTTTHPSEIPESAEKLYNDYAAMLYGYILLKVSDRHLADKVFQTSMVYAIRHHAYYDSTKYRIFSWLVQIASREIAEVNVVFQDYKQMGVVPC